MKFLCEVVLVLTVLQVSSVYAGITTCSCTDGAGNTCTLNPTGFNRDAEGYGDVEYGYDCPGNTIQEYSDRRLKKCAKTCRDDTTCVSFILDRTSGADHCVLKSKCDHADWVPATNMGIFIKESDCEGGWLKYDGSCYLFVTSPKLEWADAQAYCVEKQSTLAVVETMPELIFIRDQVLSLTDTTHQYWWLWGSYHSDGKWYWDESPDMQIQLNSNYHDANNLWYPNEPNNAAEKHLDIIVRRHQSGQYADENGIIFGINDEKETQNQPFVCMRY